MRPNAALAFLGRVFRQQKQKGSRLGSRTLVDHTSEERKGSISRVQYIGELLRDPQGLEDFEEAREVLAGYPAEAADTEYVKWLEEQIAWCQYDYLKRTGDAFAAMEFATKYQRSHQDKRT